jgi:hypothetical protein
MNKRVKQYLEKKKNILFNIRLFTHKDTNIIE